MLHVARALPAIRRPAGLPRVTVTVRPKVIR